MVNVPSSKYKGKVTFLAATLRNINNVIIVA